MKKRVSTAVCCFILSASIFTGCGVLDDMTNSVKGSISGNTYTAEFYTDYGDNFMTAKGEKISLEGNSVVTSEDGETKSTLTSVVTINIDGNEIQNCGSTVIFTEKGLKPDVDFRNGVGDIESSASGVGDNVMISSVVNDYKNMFGKSRVVVIQSQLGNPICAYSGDDCYWKVCDDLPKTTKIMIDGKALYIHRANFQIIDRELIN